MFAWSYTLPSEPKIIPLVEIDAGTAVWLELQSSHIEAARSRFYGHLMQAFMQRELTSTDLYTVHDSTAEEVAAIVDHKLPWVIRHNGRLKTILHPRYASEAEADCAALGLNHAVEAK